MECKATQHSCLMVCAACEQCWDVNDPEPPQCKPVFDTTTYVKPTRQHLENAMEEIDAAMFGGDAFYDKTNADALGHYIARWERQLQRIRQHRLDEESE